MKIFILLFISLGICTQGNTQENVYEAYQYRSVGPVRGGRVTTVAGTAMQPETFYLGATGGGVWKTTDYGITWHNISDGFFMTPSIGSIDVSDQDPNIIYVGTGSDGIRSNVVLGKGVYKSIDAGKTWKHIGLEAVGQIGAISVHPGNHNVVYVAAQGNPFAATPDRGVYKTEDGGRSWQKILYISNESGFSDLELLPGNPEIILAAVWKNERKPWTIVSGGENREGGLYKSINGGKTWEKITEGLPSGLIGKIDLAVCPSDSKLVYALVEAPAKEGGLYKSEDQGVTFVQVSDNRDIRTRPFYYTNVEVNPQNCEVVYALATGYYKSENGGKDWQGMSSPHGDNHDMWINPDNPDLIIQSNDGGANVTHNGGKTWSSQFNQPTAEIYQVEVDDQYPYWLYGGQQDNYTTIALPSMAPTGVQDPENGFLINTGGCETGPAVPKPGDPNIVYANCKGRFFVYDKRTGLEREYSVGARNMYGHNPKELKYRFQRVSPIHVSPHNPNVVYHGSQYLHKTTDEGKTWETISPDLTAFEEDKQVISGSPITRDITGEEFYSTIYSVRESPLQEGVIWIGANDGPVHITQDGGVNWKNVTPSDLPSGGRVDAVEPSAHNPAKAYIAVLRYQLGDERPYIYRTDDFGKSWSLLTRSSSGFPQNYPTRVIREDSEKEGLLYAGTEWGMLISHDDGKTWSHFQQNLPVTPITDIKVHRNDIVLSTMGRGFWILDKINAMHDPIFAKLDGKSHLFKPSDTYKYHYPKMRGGHLPRPHVIIDYYLAEDAKDGIQLEIFDADGMLVQSYSSKDRKLAAGGERREMATNKISFIVNPKLKEEQGFHRFHWYMNHRGPWHKSKVRSYQGGPSVSPGLYTVVLKIGDQKLEQSFELKTDPRISAGGVSLADIKQQEKLNLAIVDLISQSNRFVEKLKMLKKNLASKDSLQEDERNERIEKINDILSKIETAPGTYMKPMFASQLSYLYGITNGPDGLPGEDAYKRYGELKQELAEMKSELKVNE